jgi:putative transposase
MEGLVMARHRSRVEIAALVKAIDKQRAKGIPLADCCKAQGVTEQSYYRWRGAAAADKHAQARQLREATAENDRLKHALAEVMLDNQMLREVAKKKW